MYRLVIHGLTCLAVVAVILGFFGILPFSGWQLFGSLILLVAACLVLHELLKHWFSAPANIESTIITALILFFILSPFTNLSEALTLVIAAIFATASKYILAYRKRHLFNPAAFGAVVIGALGSPLVSWWVGSAPLIIFTPILGFAIARKVRRFTMVASCIASSLAVIMIYAARLGTSPADAFVQAWVSWPLVFFATIMLTEPFTTPPTQRWRIAYGALIGVLFPLPFHVGPLYSAPELALLIGNLLSFAVSLKMRLGLCLKEKNKLAAGLYEFVFIPDHPLQYRPGQYLEWTLPHRPADRRGIRRYFTVASSPTEDMIRLGVRISENPSSFKKALVNLSEGTRLSAAPLAGDFTLPRDREEKLAFIAGGIGVTPFRSMVKYLLDTGEKRDVVLFYMCASFAGFAYMDLFESAKVAFGMKIVPLVTNPQDAGADWKGRVGMLTDAVVKEEAPDYLARRYYLSGPSAMVDTYKALLKTMGVPRKKIMTDYFPGF